MKKIISVGEMLTRKQMSRITGGDEMLEPADGGSCCAHSGDWVHKSCGLTKEQAQASNLAYWCCASCYSSCMKATGGPC
jgi:hypothetical protein